MIAGPTGFEHIRTLLKIRECYPSAFYELFRKYGDTTHLVLPFKTYLCFHPEDVAKIIKHRVKSFPKSSLYGVLEPLIGEGVLMSDGDLWKRQRRLLAPEFQNQRLDGFLDLIQANVNHLLEVWEGASEKEDAHDIAPDMVRLTFRVVGETLLGTDVETQMAEIGTLLGQGLHYSTKILFSPIRFPYWVPAPTNVRYLKVARRINQLVSEIIELKKAKPSSAKGDVLTRLLKAQENADTRMSEQLLLDEVKTILFAGHETTSNALCWTLYLLSQHPEVEQKLIEEVDSVLCGRLPGLEDLDKLQYTLCVLKESLRLFPPVPAVNRLCTQEETLRDVTVKPGELVEIVPYVTHRHPDYWERPDDFYPERFEVQQKDPNAMAFFPFLGGPRVCMGEAFAYMEMKIAVASIYQRFRVSLAQKDVKIEALQTMRPKGNRLFMKIEKRKPAAVLKALPLR